LVLSPTAERQLALAKDAAGASQPRQSDFPANMSHEIRIIQSEMTSGIVDMDALQQGPGLGAGIGQEHLVPQPLDQRFHYLFDCRGRLPRSIRARESGHGMFGGGTRRLVACSKAYASAISLGSLHAIPVKLTP
jgi:hypothetical protein